MQNAVVDAVAHLGVRHIDMPLTPERVWRAIQESGPLIVEASPSRPCGCPGASTSSSSATATTASPTRPAGCWPGGSSRARYVPDGRVEVVYPTANADASARTYSVDSRDLIRSIRAAEAQGLELVGVFHSHTHTEAWPSPTDVRQAMEPGWLYVIVSLKDGDPVLRSFRITDGNIQETPVVLES